MDKACITVAAAHKHMLSTASSAASMGGLSMLGIQDQRAKVRVP